MATLRNFISNLAVTVGPNTAHQARPTRIAVASAAEDTVTITAFDKVMFETFGKDSAVIPAGEHTNPTC